MLALIAAALAGPLPSEAFFDAYARARSAGESVAALFREDAAVVRPEAAPIAGRAGVAAESARLAALGCTVQVHLGLVRDARTVFVEEAVACPPGLGAWTATLTRFELDDAGLVLRAKSWVSLVPLEPPPGVKRGAAIREAAVADTDRVLVVRDLHARDKVPPAPVTEDVWATPRYVVTVGERWMPTGTKAADMAEVAVFTPALAQRRVFVGGAGLRWQPWSGQPRP